MRASSTIRNTGGPALEEARGIAEQMADADSKRTMIGIAEGYDKLACRAEERVALTRSTTAERAVPPKSG